MRFGMWNVRSLHRPEALMRMAREFSEGIG